MPKIELKGSSSFAELDSYFKWEKNTMTWNLKILKAMKTHKSEMHFKFIYQKDSKHHLEKHCPPLHILVLIKLRFRILWLLDLARNQYCKIAMQNSMSEIVHFVNKEFRKLWRVGSNDQIHSETYWFSLHMEKGKVLNRTSKCPNIQTQNRLVSNGEDKKIQNWKYS